MFARQRTALLGLTGCAVLACTAASRPEPVPKPGEWQLTKTLVSAWRREIPIRLDYTTETDRTCVGAGERWFAEHQYSHCRLVHRTVDANHISASFKCDRGRGAIRMEDVEGEVSSTGFQLRKRDTTRDSKGDVQRVEWKVSGRWVGPCRTRGRPPATGPSRD